MEVKVLLLLLPLLVAGKASAMEPIQAAAPDVTQPVLEHRVLPSYPSRAASRRVDGLVILEAIISREGTVVAPRVVRCSAMGYGLEAAALDVLQHWRYRPGTKNGIPIDVYFTIIVEFSLTPPGINAYFPHPEWTSAYLEGLQELAAENHEEAGKVLQRAMGFAEEDFRQRDVRLAWTFEAVANLHVVLNQVDEANAILTRALGAYEKALGRRDLQLTPVLTMLAGVHVSRGDPAAAEPLLRRALKIRENSLGKQHRQVAATLYQLGLVSTELGQEIPARIALNRAAAILEKLPSPDPELKAKVDHALAATGN